MWKSICTGGASHCSVSKPVCMCRAGGASYRNLPKSACVCHAGGASYHSLPRCVCMCRAGGASYHSLLVLKSVYVCLTGGASHTGRIGVQKWPKPQILTIFKVLPCVIFEHRID